ncbi:hypothetical protein BDA99DRAFT_503630 [Phascolomyces articulosus]|uniref:Uncharacterized protein n=1 Tax=Phascolomyces articulosus TaxID=60185 RepID=A0AAD5K4P6_9FUNG|nr:hypothetical protein BDA99DRAFT_503630 [Phascolomyces articulosus]
MRYFFHLYKKMFIVLAGLFNRFFLFLKKSREIIDEDKTRHISLMKKKKNRTDQYLGLKVRASIGARYR